MALLPLFSSLLRGGAITGAKVLRKKRVQMRFGFAALLNPTKGRSDGAADNSLISLNYKRLTQLLLLLNPLIDRLCAQVFELTTTIPLILQNVLFGWVVALSASGFNFFALFYAWAAALASNSVMREYLKCWCWI